MTQQDAKIIKYCTDFRNEEMQEHVDTLISENPLLQRVVFRSARYYVCRQIVKNAERTAQVRGTWKSPRPIDIESYRDKLAARGILLPPPSPRAPDTVRNVPGLDVATELNLDAERRYANNGIDPRRPEWEWIYDMDEE